MTQDSRQLYGLWAYRAWRREALKSGHFQKCRKLLFCCHEFNMNQHNMKWAWGILVTSHFLRLLSKQPSRKKKTKNKNIFFHQTCCKKKSSVNFITLKKKNKKKTPRHIVQTNVCFTVSVLNMWKMPHIWSKKRQVTGRLNAVFNN